MLVQRVQGRIAVGAAFVGSLALSVFAHLGSSLNRDGMIYVRSAQAFLDGGLDAARESFNWLFLPILMALVSMITGMGPEMAGHVLNALFMAGACALMVDCVARRQPELAGWACLAVLAVSGINEYRSELLREYGCWFFVVLSFWLALRWHDRPSWLGAFGVQLALFGASLFRSEALALFPALLLWQVFAAVPAQRGARLLMLGVVPAMIGGALLALHLGGHLPSGNRIADDFGRFSLAEFDTKADALAAALIEYARDDARSILFFGSLALVPLKLLQKLGPFVVPLAFLFLAHGARPALARYPLFAWGIAAHLAVLAVFVTDLQFLSGRYVGLTLWFCVPFVAAGMFAMAGRYPRWRLVIIALALAMMIANVVSSGERRTHVIEAGQWLAVNAEQSPAIYIDSRRVAHYAQWHEVPLARRNDRAAIARAAAQGTHTLFVLEVSSRDEPILPWLAQHRLRVARSFEGAGGAAVLVVLPADEVPAPPVGE